MRGKTIERIGTSRRGEHDRVRFFRVVGFVLTLGLMLNISTSLRAQDVGDKAVVTTESVLKIREEEVGKLFPGTIVTVTHVNGNWLALQGIKGWIHSKYLAPLDEAARQYDLRLQVNPEDVEALATRGLISYHRGQFNESIGFYNEALRLNPRLPQLWNNRSLALIAQSRFELAEKDLRQALKLSPEFAEAYSNLGWVYSSGFLWEEAIENYNKAIERNPENSVYYVDRGSCYRALGRFEKAMADFDKALELTINLPTALVGKASIYLDQRELKQAIHYCNEALKLDEDNVQALVNRGWAQYLVGQKEEGLKDLQQALRYDDSVVEAYINRSVIYLQMREWDKARADLNRARELASEDPIVWLNLGELEMAQGKYLPAREAFEKALEFGPDMAETHNGVAWILSTAENAEVRDAAQAVEKALKANELSEYGDWSHLDTLGAAYANQSNFDEAIRWATKAAELAPDTERQPIQQRLELYRTGKPFRDSGN